MNVNSKHEFSILEIARLIVQAKKISGDIETDHTKLDRSLQKTYRFQQSIWYKK